MKQTVEEATKEFAKSVIDSFGTNGVPSGISDIKEMIALGFENGAEWQAKQSPWISIEERLPEEGQNVLVLIEYLIRDKINKMCTLKKWRIDYESKPNIFSCDIHHISIIHRSLPTDILTVQHITPLLA